MSEFDTKGLWLTFWAIVVLVVAFTDGVVIGRMIQEQVNNGKGHSKVIDR